MDPVIISSSLGGCDKKAKLAGLPILKERKREGIGDMGVRGLYLDVKGWLLIPTGTCH